MSRKQHRQQAQDAQTGGEISAEQAAKMVREAENVVEDGPKPAEYVNLTLRVLRCPCCLKGMSPRVISTNGNIKRLRCGLNGCTFTAIYENGSKEAKYVRGWKREE